MPRGIYEHKPREVTEYIETHASENITRRDIYEHIVKNICPDITYDYVRAYYRRNGLPSKPDTHTHNEIFTETQKEYLLTIIAGTPSNVIAEKMNEKFGLNVTTSQIQGWKKNHRTPSGYDTRWRKGSINYAKGKKWDEYMPKESQLGSLRTCFKKGNIPANHKEVGTIVFRESSGYLWIKVQEKPAKWKMLQGYIWEHANGPVPDGSRLMFLDGNPLNCTLENLRLVKKSVISCANTHFKLTKNAEINEAILKAAELRLMISALERKEQ